TAMLFVAAMLPVVAAAQTASFDAPMDFGVGTNPNSLAVGDFNGDGKADLAIANFASNNISVMLGNGDGSFQAAQSFPAGVNPAFIGIADLNGDGKPDLMAPNYGSANVSI